jgi:spore germination cell wall hydrolase CwlJ-like protein
MNPALVVALTIWAEARGESAEGRAAVASVIWTRAAGEPARLKTVCLRRKQFSCWNDGSLARMKAWGPSWEQAQALAAQMTTGKFKPTIRATHYHATYVQPVWASEMRQVRKIGQHVFYVRKARRA